MNKGYLALGISFSLLAHAVMLHALTGSQQESSGNAVSTGDIGVDTGLGQIGSYANTTERLQQLQKKVEIKPEMVEPPVKPDIKTEPVKVAVAENTYRLQETTPETTPEKPPKKIQEPPPEPVEASAIETPVVEEQKEPEPDQAPTDDIPEQAASDAMVKATGNADQQTSGGAAGNQRTYIQDLYQWLARHRTYPPIAKKSKQEGTVLLAFTVNRHGDISESSIKKSSGYPLLDEAAIRMLEKASPLPPVPDDFYPSRNHLPLVMPIEFSLITNSSFGE
ncbi:MAG: energy transducer TonB [Thalassolituus sp.]